MFHQLPGYPVAHCSWDIKLNITTFCLVNHSSFSSKSKLDWSLRSQWWLHHIHTHLPLWLQISEWVPMTLISNLSTAPKPCWVWPFAPSSAPYPTPVLSPQWTTATCKNASCSPLNHISLRCSFPLFAGSYLHLSHLSLKVIFLGETFISHLPG